MRILLYLGHPAQYHFIKHTILELRKRGHEIYVLIKTKDILEKLLIIDGVNYKNIQINSRKNTLLSILTASIIRTFKVLKYAKQKNIDLLLGTDSSISQAAFLLNKKAITTLEDDYEVIKKLAKLTFPFTNTILVPMVCRVGKWERKKIGYDGYMKLAYLHPLRFKPNEKLKDKYIKEQNYVIIRLAQLTAHHDKGIKGLNLSLVKTLIETIELNNYKVFLTSEAQLDEQLKKYELRINPSDIHHILYYASLLISDSQSMSMEASILGTPSIRYSDFKGKINVLEELEIKYHLTYGVKIDEIDKLHFLSNELLKPKVKEEFKIRRDFMIADKIDVTNFLCWFIENYPESHRIMKEDPDYQFNFR